MKWWSWRRIGLALVALAGLLGSVLARGPRWQRRAQDVSQGATQAAQEAVAARAQEQEAKVDQELQEKRRLPGAERVAAALRRARARRAGGGPAAGG